MGGVGIFIVKNPDNPIFMSPGGTKRREFSRISSSAFILSPQKGVIQETCTIGLAKDSLGEVLEKEAKRAQLTPSLSINSLDKDHGCLDCRL